MEFDKSRVYTALNADELKPGSKVIVADRLSTLKVYVENDDDVVILSEINDEEHDYRFKCGDTSCGLAYLVELPEENKLKWIDLKVGDIIGKKFYDGYRTAMIVIIDTCSDTTKHIGIANGWLDDTEIEDWEIVNDKC